MIKKIGSLFWGGPIMLRVLICEDDIFFLEKITEKIRSILLELDVKAKVHPFSDADQISDQILSSCDIAFLDIDFAHKSYNGIDTARKLRSFRKDTVIIFITNFIEFAPVGYEVQAFRYILKQEVEKELKPYIQQAISHISSQREMIKIQINGEIIDVLIDDILYFEVQQHSVTLYAQKDKLGKSQKTYSFHASLSELEKALEPHGFLRIHKSFLVNMKYISTFKCKEALLNNGIVLRVSEKKYPENKRKYLSWRGWQ